MNIRTKRLKTATLRNYGELTPKEQTDSQEYYALAVLRTLFPSEYCLLEKKHEDRPDLRSIDDKFGVEVTTADSEADNQINRELSKYTKDRNGRRIQTIKRNNKVVVEEYGITTVQSGGGYSIEEDKELLIKRIRNKIDSVNKYDHQYEWLELVVLKYELVPHIWTEKVFDYIDEAIMGSEEIFKKIYFIYRDKCFCYYFTGERIIKNIDDMIGLRLLAYLTSKHIIKDNDDEWL